MTNTNDDANDASADRVIGEIAIGRGLVIDFWVFLPKFESISWLIWNEVNAF